MDVGAGANVIVSIRGVPAAKSSIVFKGTHSDHILTVVVNSVLGPVLESDCVTAVGSTIGGIGNDGGERLTDLQPGAWNIIPADWIPHFAVWKSSTGLREVITPAPGGLEEIITGGWVITR